MSSCAMTLNSLAGLSATIPGEINTGVTTAGTFASAGLAIAGATAAIPFVGAAVAAVTLLVSAFNIGQGCGPTCTASTQVVNTIEPYMQQNVAAAQQQAQLNGGCLTADEQMQLVANFDTLWQQVVQGCGQVPAPGGTQCVSDRHRGGKYDWFSYYLDPINQLPVCAGSALSAPGSVSLNGLAVPALLIAAAFLIGGSN